MKTLNQIFFNDRDGHTVLSVKERRGLLLSHVTNMKELDEAEQLNINEGILWLGQSREKDYITESFFLKLHKQLFGQVWKWAGKYRTSDKNIGIVYWKIPTEMHKFLNDVEYWLKHETFKNWEEFLAHFHHRLVYIHPFPNGNGRFSRIVTNYLSFKLGKPVPTWHHQLSAKNRREIYIKALRAADQRKYGELIEFFKSMKGEGE